MKIAKFYTLLAMALGYGIVAMPQPAAGEYRCLPAGGTTGAYWGTGATCGAAAASWKGQAQQEEEATCWPDGVCQMSPPWVVDTPCYWDDATQAYREEGEGRFRCYVWIDP